METRRRFDIVLWGGVILLLHVVFARRGCFEWLGFCSKQRSREGFESFPVPPQLYGIMETCWISEISEPVLISPLGLKSKKIIEIEWNWMTEWLDCGFFVVFLFNKSAWGSFCYSNFPSFPIEIFCRQSIEPCRDCQGGRDQNHQSQRSVNRRRSFRHIQMLAKQQSHTLTLGQLMRPRNQGLILICVYFISCLWIPFLYIHPCQQWTFTYHLCFWSIFLFLWLFSISRWHINNQQILTESREISFGKEHTLRHSLFDSAGEDLPV